ncbi:site-specific DNA-methyltransferase [Piscinibacter defluvii]|uniref:site-specific DNA-methyltransferase n=1 Tax=Piscinibacter defluvii TaxID=1796922 RepID=UPI000FDCFB76|nr:site-specific DNA-methyltransferase [Piscinibacter defluvii]
MPTLDWLNRDAAFRIADRVPTRVLRPHAAGHRFGTAGAGNLLVHGDNLEALKALLPFYRGRVKCIFIDPPYNTKSAFEHYDDNLEHSQWLSMMLPRLQLLREFLREDGSLWVTIDDNEGHYLKVLMDEVFGRTNFVANVVWQKKYAKQNDAQWLSTSHDHVLAYARKANAWRPNKVARTADQLKGFANIDDDPRGPWQSVVYTCAKTKSERPNLYYPIEHPSTKKSVLPLESRVWAYDSTKHEQHVRENRIWWGKNHEKDKPRLKVFLSELADGVVADTLWLRDLVGDNQDSKREGLALFGGGVFGTPKPERFMGHLISIATSEGDLVLDSFLGSGTTAAVAHKMGRRWIGIEMGEHAVTHCVPRLQKVIDGERGGISDAVNWQGGGGFELMQLGEPLFDAVGDIHPEVRFADLAAFVWLRETGAAWQPGAAGTPLLGRAGDTAYYLLFNGILGDRRPEAGNVLTSAVLEALRQTCWHAGPKVVYGEACRLGEARLAAEGLVFKQLPHALPR